MSSMTRKRLWWLTTCAVFVACASGPAPTPTKKKRKKKRSKDEVALKKQKDADRDDEDKPDRPKRDKDEEVAVADDDVSVSDDSEDEAKTKKKGKQKKKAREDETEDTGSKSKKKKTDDETEEVASKSKKKSEEEEAIAPKSKKKKKTETEEVTSKSKKASEEEEEVAPKSKKKKTEDEEVASKSKRKKTDGEEVATKSKKQKAEDDEAAAAKSEEEAEEVVAKSKSKKAKQTKASAKSKAKAEDEEETAAKSEEEAEEVAAKPKTKKGKQTKVAAKSKRKADEETEVAAEEPPEVEPEPAKTKRKPDKVAAKAKPKTAEVDMTSDEGVIDMEDTSGSSLDNRIDDAPPERRAVAIAVPGVDSGDEEAAATAEATPLGANPRVINERPLTLPKSKLAVHGGLRVGVLTLPNPAGMDVTTTSEGLALGVNYGVSDSSEVGFDYTLGLSPGSLKGPLTLHGAYRAVSGAKLDVAIAAGVAIDFSDLTDPVTMQTTTRTAFSLELGAWARYRLTRKVSAFSGLPALPASTVSLSKFSFALPPLPYQLAIGLNNDGAIALDLPVGVAYQATPKLYTLFMLDLAHIRVANTANAIIFRDFIPVSLGGFYSLDKLDIGVLFSDDLKQGTDYLRLDTVVRYSIK
ncbi:MAG TPA: hypothetical protein VIV40_25595 [Kofleriaceae bacterium]